MALPAGGREESLHSNGISSPWVHPTGWLLWDNRKSKEASSSCEVPREGNGRAEVMVTLGDRGHPSST